MMVLYQIARKCNVCTVSCPREQIEPARLSLSEWSVLKKENGIDPTLNLGKFHLHLKRIIIY